MTTATQKQIAFINRLIAEAGYETVADAAEAYGFRRIAASELTIRQASELIDWLKSGGRAAVETAQPFEPGQRFTSAQGSGRIITLLSDNRYLVKFDNGVSGFLTGPDFLN